MLSAPGHSMFCFGTVASFYFSGFRPSYVLLLIPFSACALISWYHLLQLLSSYLLIVFAVSNILWVQQKKKQEVKWNKSQACFHLSCLSCVLHLHQY